MFFVLPLQALHNFNYISAFPCPPKSPVLLSPLSLFYTSGLNVMLLPLLEFSHFFFHQTCHMLNGASKPTTIRNPSSSPEISPHSSFVMLLFQVLTLCSANKEGASRHILAKLGKHSKDVASPTLLWVSEPSAYTGC